MDQGSHSKSSGFGAVRVSRLGSVYFSNPGRCVVTPSQV